MIATSGRPEALGLGGRSSPPATPGFCQKYRAVFNRFYRPLLFNRASEKSRRRDHPDRSSPNTRSAPMNHRDAAIRSGRNGSAPARPRQDVRRAVVVAILFLAGLGCLTLAVIWATSPRAPISLGPTDLLVSQDGRVARVVATANGRCEQSTFDNDTA